MRETHTQGNRPCQPDTQAQRWDTGTHGETETPMPPTEVQHEDGGGGGGVQSGKHSPTCRRVQVHTHTQPAEVTPAASSPPAGETPQPLGPLHPCALPWPPSAPPSQLRGWG